jgi:demethylmenaquinone methyltransferase/2-methoxy-6-polyprenyl-1,4-benzoquinol methylase
VNDPSIAGRGTTPPGTDDERQAAAWVKQMFAAVAPRYDFLNHLLSFNIDRRWRARLLAAVQPVLEKQNPVVLDLCCGTGDVLIELQKNTKGAVMGADFCHPMLVEAARKTTPRRFLAPLFEADALDLPLHDGSLDLITIAFGFRNLANYEAGLLELWRTLKPGGMVAILEFSHPRSWFMRVSYGVYSRALLPMIGSVVSGRRDAYTYLPESIGRFPKAPQLKQMMNSAGFAEVSFELLTGGIAALHIGRKAD